MSRGPPPQGRSPPSRRVRRTASRPPDRVDPRRKRSVAPERRGTRPSPPASGARCFSGAQAATVSPAIRTARRTDRWGDAMGGMIGKPLSGASVHSREPWRSSCRSTAAPRSATPTGSSEWPPRCRRPQGGQPGGGGRLGDGQVAPTISSPWPSRSAVAVIPREMDMLLTAGERISMALLAMAIRDQDVEAMASPVPRQASSPTPATARRRSATSGRSGSRRASTWAGW